MEAVKKTFKCPICGGEEFVKEEMCEYDDGYSRKLADEYVCFNCGYVILINDGYLAVKKAFEAAFFPHLQALDLAIENHKPKALEINKKRLELEQEKEKLLKESKNPDRSVRRDEEIRKRLKSIELELNQLANEKRHNDYQIEKAENELRQILADSSGFSGKGHYELIFREHLAKKEQK